MFDPIKASKEIKRSYIDYITTAFDMADPTYKKEFRSELEKEDAVAKGPFWTLAVPLRAAKPYRN